MLITRQLVVVHDANDQFRELRNSQRLEVAGKQPHEQPGQPEYFMEDVPNTFTGILIGQQLLAEGEYFAEQLPLDYAFGAGSEVVLLDYLVEGFEVEL